MAESGSVVRARHIGGSRKYSLLVHLCLRGLTASTKEPQGGASTLQPPPSVGEGQPRRRSASSGLLAILRPAWQAGQLVRSQYRCRWPISLPVGYQLYLPQDADDRERRHKPLRSPAPIRGAAASPEETTISINRACRRLKSENIIRAFHIWVLYWIDINRQPVRMERNYITVGHHPIIESRRVIVGHRCVIISIIGIHQPSF